MSYPGWERLRAGSYESDKGWSIEHDSAWKLKPDTWFLHNPEGKMVGEGFRTLREAMLEAERKS